MLTQATAQLFNGDDGVIDGFVHPHLAWTTGQGSIDWINETTSSCYTSEMWIGPANKAMDLALRLISLIDNTDKTLGLCDSEKDGACVMLWEEDNFSAVAVIQTGDRFCGKIHDVNQDDLEQVLWDGNDNSPYEMWEEPRNDILKARLRKFIMDKWQPED